MNLLVVDRIPERDWKKLRSMKDDRLNVACARILKKVEAVIADRSEGDYTTYLALWRLLKAEDYEIGLMFDDLKRSTAVRRLAEWRRNDLLDDETLANFSEDSRDAILELAKARREGKKRGRRRAGK